MAKKKKNQGSQKAALEKNQSKTEEVVEEEASKESEPITLEKSAKEETPKEEPKAEDTDEKETVITEQENHEVKLETNEDVTSNFEDKKEIVKPSVGNQNEEVEELDLFASLDSKPNINLETTNNQINKQENDQTNNSKFFLVFIVVILLIAGGIFGYIKWDEANNNKLEKAISDPAKDYFDKYMSANASASAYKVTLEMLKEANQAGENYDLKAFDKCDPKTTTVTITINYATGEISDTTVKLNCKKY